MVSMTTMMILSCLLLATAISIVDSQPLQLDALSPDSPSRQTDRKPDMVMLALCWNGQSYVEECQKDSTLMKQLLYKLLYRMKTGRRNSEPNIFDDEEEGPNRRMPAKRIRDDTSGFYSNW